MGRDPKLEAIANKNPSPQNLFNWWFESKKSRGENRQTTNQKIVKDRRDDLQKETLTCLLGAKDIYMSGWGDAEGMNSYAAWACREEHREMLREWLNTRTDLEELEDFSESLPNFGHITIYPFEKDHPGWKK